MINWYLFKKSHAFRFLTQRPSFNGAEWNLFYEKIAIKNKKSLIPPFLFTYNTHGPTSINHYLPSNSLTTMTSFDELKASNCESIAFPYPRRCKVLKKIHFANIWHPNRRISSIWFWGNVHSWQEQIRFISSNLPCNICY